MIASILNATYIIITLVAVILLSIYGWKTGWRGGLRVLGFTLVSIFISTIFTSSISSSLNEWQQIRDLHASAAGTAEGFGISSSLISSVLSDSIIRILQIPIFIILFISCIILINIIWLIIKLIAKFKKEPISKPSKATGLIVGIATPLCILAAVMLIPDIKYMEEAQRADLIISSAPRIIASPESILEKDNIKLYTDLYFDTNIISATEKERLELINTAISAVFEKSDNSILHSFSNSFNYSTREDLVEDLYAISDIITNLKSIDFTSPESIIEKLSDTDNIAKIADSLYSLEFSEPVIKQVVSYAVQTISGDTSFELDDSVVIEGSKENFAELIEVIKDIDFEQGISEEEIKALEASPLIPPEAIAKIHEMKDR